MLMHLHASYLTTSFDYDEERRIISRQPVADDRLMMIEYGYVLTHAELMTASTDVKDMCYPYDEDFFTSAPSSRSLLNDVLIVAHTDPKRNMEYMVIDAPKFVREKKHTCTNRIFNSRDCFR